MGAPLLPFLAQIRRGWRRKESSHRRRCGNALDASLMTTGKTGPSSGPNPLAATAHSLLPERILAELGVAAVAVKARRRLSNVLNSRARRIGRPHPGVHRSPVLLGAECRRTRPNVRPGAARRYEMPPRIEQRVDARSTDLRPRRAAPARPPRGMERQISIARHACDRRERRCLLRTRSPTTAAPSSGGKKLLLGSPSCLVRKSLTVQRAPTGPAGPGRRSPT